jgi:hypothetical protein
MKNVFLPLALVGTLAISACAQSSAPEFATFESERIEIQAEMTPGLLDAEVKLLINNELIINERSQTFGGSSQVFHGTWNGKQVTARATAVQKFMSSYILVDVFIDGVLVETLTV